MFDSLDYDITSMDLPKDNVYYVACPLRYTRVLEYAKEFLKTNNPISVRAISIIVPAKLEN